MSNAIRSAITAVIGSAGFAVLLFLPAGTLNYWQGWTFLGVFSAASLAPTLFLNRVDPAVIERRMHAGPKAETRAVQKAVIVGTFACFAALLVVSGLDHRFGWSNVPAAVSVLGDVMVGAGLGVAMLVVYQNRYAAATITVEDGQPLVTTGLYGIVRHPMYSGSVVMIIGMALALASYWALLIAVAGMLLLVIRLLDEEKLLTEELRLHAESAVPIGATGLVIGASVTSVARALDTPWRRSGRLRYALSRVRSAVAPPVTVTDPPIDIVTEHDTAVTTRDGTVLRVNVFRPPGDARRSVILCAHPYGKDNLPRRRRGGWTFSPQYRALRQPSPVRFSALTSWEAPDPAWWVAQGFAVVNADLRGCGTSDGTGRLLSRQEAEDTYDIIGWAAEQPWCDGRVAMSGVSYLAISQYAVAALRPHALKAIVPWEGFTDVYRDLAFPGGVREKGFIRLWGAGVRRTTRQSYDVVAMGDTHPLRDEFWQSLVPDLSAITVPMLVCGSFSDHNLHTRGSFRAFAQTNSRVAHLYTHRGGKWATYYSAVARAAQLVFIRTALDGAASESSSRTVRLEVREDRDTIVSVREELQWPPARTDWRRLHLSRPGELSTEAPTQAGSVAFNTRSRAAAFTWTVPEDTELTGPMAARLWLEIDGGGDADLFVGVEKWRHGRFVPFEGSYGYGRDRVSTGWQRVALRALDPELSTPWEPVPSCTAAQPVAPGEIVAVDVALLASATLFRAGEQLRLVVAGRWPVPRNPFTGQFPAAYPASPRRRVILYWGPSQDAHLLVPVIPA